MAQVPGTTVDNDNSGYITKVLKKNGQVVDGLIVNGKTYYLTSDGKQGSRIQDGDYVKAIDGVVYKMVDGSGVKQNGSFGSIVDQYSSLDDGGSGTNDDTGDDNSYDPDRPDGGTDAYGYPDFVKNPETYDLILINNGFNPDTTYYEELPNDIKDLLYERGGVYDPNSNYEDQQDADGTGGNTGDNNNSTGGNNKGYIFDNSQDGKLFVIDADTYDIVDTITPDNIKDNVDTIMAGYGINPDQEDIPDWLRVGLREEGGTTGKDGEDGYTDDGYVDLSDTTQWNIDNSQSTNEDLGITNPDDIGNLTAEDINAILEGNGIGTGGRPELMDGGTLADMFGITNDRSEIEQILLNAANSKNDYAKAQQGVNEDRFYDDLANVQNTVLDTLGVNKLNAIQSGASKGMTAANELSAILGLEQTAMAGANQLAADRKLLADQAAMDQEAAIMNALAQANTTGLKMGDTAANVLNADMVGYGSELNHDSALRGILGNIEAQRIASNAQLGSARINADATIKTGGSRSQPIDTGFYAEMKKAGFTDEQIRTMVLRERGYTPDENEENGGKPGSININYHGPTE